MYTFAKKLLFSINWHVLNQVYDPQISFNFFKYVKVYGTCVNAFPLSSKDLHFEFFL